MQEEQLLQVLGHTAETQGKVLKAKMGLEEAVLRVERPTEVESLVIAG